MEVEQQQDRALARGAVPFGLAEALAGKGHHMLLGRIAVKIRHDERRLYEIERTAGHRLMARWLLLRGCGSCSRRRVPK